MNVLLTGGSGYIGSHTCVECINAGYDVVVVDNLSNSQKESIERIQGITGKQITFYPYDLLDAEKISSVFEKHSIDSVIHFAGLKAVSESSLIPMKYYQNNVTGTLNLLETMKKYHVFKLVFSSSAAVYGHPEKAPIAEDSPLNPNNPYARTKIIIESILQDVYSADDRWNIAILRYFNPIGAHESGLIGEFPNNIPNNLMPYLSQVAVGKLKELLIFGNDYPTHDGTGVRDYVHVLDLSSGHVKALDKLEEKPGIVVYNLGTGKGYSVLEIIKIFEKTSSKTIPYKIVKRRPGDVPINYADPSLAHRELNWHARRSIEEMCLDTWRWQSRNPNGYNSK